MARTDERMKGDTADESTLAHERHRRRLRVAIGCGAALCTVFALRNWLMADAPATAIVEAVTALVLLGLGAAVTKGLGLRWAERATAAVLLSVTVAVSFSRGGFHPEALVWNVLIPLSLLTAGRLARTAVWSWTALIVLTTCALYLVAGDAERDATSLISLVALFPVVAILGELYMEDRDRLHEANLVLERQRSIGAKMESVGRLAGGIAHEFNNLLTIISTHAELASDDRNHPLDELRDATERGRQITRQLMGLGGRGVRAPIAMYPTDTVQATVRVLERALPENIRLSSRLEADPWCVCADPSDIEQAVLNLALNARDAMTGGGELSIRCGNTVVDRRRHPGDPQVSPGRYVEIEVADTGLGMSSELMGQIFDPFFTTKTNSRSTGLGLTSAYAAVRKLGGDITVRSDLGQGSRFSIFLPASDESSDVMARSRQQGSNAAPSPGTVLLVEDEDGVRTATGLLLRSRGFAVLTAESGESALRLFEQHGRVIDVVLTDLMMPGLSGVEVARRVRTSAPEVGVVFMSGYSDDPEVERFVAEHGARFIRKPFGADELVATLNEVASKRRRLGVA